MCEKALPPKEMDMTKSHVHFFCQVASIRIFSARKPYAATARKFPAKNTRNFFEVLLTLFEPPSEFNTSITRPAFGTHPAAVLASILPLSADR